MSDRDEIIISVSKQTHAAQMRLKKAEEQCKAWTEELLDAKLMARLAQKQYERILGLQPYVKLEELKK